jgi:adenylate cyclase
MAWPRLPTIRLSELRRRRVFRAVGAYVVIGWLLLQVADVTFAPLGLPDWSQRALIIAVAVGVVPAAVLAWIFDVTRRGLVRTPPADPAALAPNGGTTTASAAPMSAIASIAVLPFTDLSKARDHGWFCDGLSEEIIDSLCCVRGLRMASRTASFRFRDGSVDPREIGRQLNVDAILEGSVRIAGQRMRVTAQLVDAKDGYHAWSETYERAVTDVFAIQREIAENVARALRLNLAGAAIRGEKHSPSSMEAYEFYLRGRQLVGQYSGRSLLEAPTFFRRAIERDPRFAQAHAGLADALALQAQWRFAPAAQVLPEGTAAASRALDLAPDLAEAHLAQGHLRSLAGDGDGAHRAFERALELNPSLFDAWHYYARDCFARGEYARAAELFRRAHAVRQDDFTPLVFVAGSLHALGDTEGAQAAYEQAAKGLLRQIELEPGNLRARYLGAGALLQVGRADEGRQLMAQALAMAPEDFGLLYNAACFHSQAGDIELGLELLERAIATGGGFPEWLQHDTDLDPLRDSPRFAAMLQRLQPATAPTPG